MKQQVQTNKIEGIDQLLGMLNCINVSLDIDNFKSWLNKEHHINLFGDLLEGYKFFIESSIRTLINALIYNSSLDIKEDFIFYRARFTGVELNKIPNTCEKIILIRNINNKLKLIKRAKNEKELISAIKQFKEVLKYFEEIYDKTEVNSLLNLDKNTALKYVTMFWVYIFLNDTSRQIPHGFWISILDNEIPAERYKKIFSGYKFALQFIWYQILGKKYPSTSIVNLYKAKKWVIRDDSFFDFKKHKPLNKKIVRNDLDSYFGKIQEGIIEPLEKGLNFDFSRSSVFYLKDHSYKNNLMELMKKSQELSLNEKERLDVKLLWYQIELLDSENIFNGVPAFNALLIGAAELKKRVGDTAYICRFIHPNKSVNGNDFSYGVLVEVSGSLGISDYSGWVLCFDCCGDYSGSAGYEHKMAEDIIKEYQDKGLIEVIEMKVDKNKFKEYIADKITKRKRKDIFNELGRESEKRYTKNIINEARGLVLELITYYTLSKDINSSVEWNIINNIGSKDQIDIILEKNSEIVFIECKYNPNNIDIYNEITKLNNKMQRFPSNKEKRGEFWFWERPLPQVIEKLNEKNTSFIVFSELIKQNPHWRSKKFNKLNTIFGEKNNEKY